jgi:hypothetical protein
MALGQVASKLGYKPAEELIKETDSFSLLKLPKKLFNPTILKWGYTKHTRLSPETIKEVIKLLQPGDIVVTCSDSSAASMFVQTVQKLKRRISGWSHMGLVTNTGNIVHSMPSFGGRMTPPETFMERSHHLMVLRPKYKDADAVDRTINEAKQLAKSAKYYDFSFSLSIDKALYCSELVTKALQKGDPEIKIAPTTFLKFKKIILLDDVIESPQMEKIYDTGSNFWMNYLSRFT